MNLLSTNSLGLKKKKKKQFLSYNYSWVQITFTY